MNFGSKLTLPVNIAIAVLVLLVVGGGYFYFQKQATKNAPATQQTAKEELKKLLAEVGKIIELPSDEEPTIATITDITKLSNQPFFIRAKNGDKVLIYTKSKKAILYDPQAKKVIDVAPINIGSQSAQTASPSPKPSATPKP